MGNPSACSQVPLHFASICGGESINIYDVHVE